MLSRLPKFLEFRILAILASIAIAIYLFQILTGIISQFSDLIIISILAWLLAFVLDPLVGALQKRTNSKTSAAIIVYSLLGIAMLVLVSFAIPTTIEQLRVLLGYLPGLFDQAPGWAGRIEGVVTSALANSLFYAQTFASLLAGLLLVIVISFYLVLSGTRLEEAISSLVPEKFREDYRFLLKTLNTTFASFLRIQVIIGLIVGLVTTIVLALFSVQFALSAGFLAGILAVIPVVGPIISILPPLLASATVSYERAIISSVVLFLIYQLIYNIVAPKLVGSALKIHPVIVILSFIVGYKLTGFWGAVFAVPLVVSFEIVAKELWIHWQKTADSL